MSVKDYVSLLGRLAPIVIALEKHGAHTPVGSTNNSSPSRGIAMFGTRLAGLILTLSFVPAVANADKFLIVIDNGATGEFEAPVGGGDVTSISVWYGSVHYQTRLIPNVAPFKYTPTVSVNGLPNLEGFFLCDAPLSNSLASKCLDTGAWLDPPNRFQASFSTCLANTVGGWNCNSTEQSFFNIYTHPGTVSITPNTDPGGLVAGDSLTFTVAVDQARPLVFWAGMQVTAKVTGDVEDSNFSGDCNDLSNLANPPGAEVAVACPEAGDEAQWTWTQSCCDSLTVLAGNLFNFTAKFDHPGTYHVYIEGASALYQSAPVNSLPMGKASHVFSPIVITVSETPEDLLAQLLQDVAILKPGKSLANKVRLAEAYLAANDIPATCAVLRDFNKEVKAQISKKKIMAAVGDKLMSDATAIMTIVGCFD